MSSYWRCFCGRLECDCPKTPITPEWEYSDSPQAGDWWRVQPGIVRDYWMRLKGGGFLRGYTPPIESDSKGT
jgi:hypothetical protein